jgi:hypothetical protein
MVPMHQSRTVIMSSNASGGFGRYQRTNTRPVDLSLYFPPFRDEVEGPSILNRRRKKTPEPVQQPAFPQNPPNITAGSSSFQVAEIDSKGERTPGFSMESNG